ncbi:hypothetical protein RAA17_01710 [Komagataeibacter rhaeticus]|nr:hypothetical protein [Komagataeibacter rhaeticus]
MSKNDFSTAIYGLGWQERTLSNVGNVLHVLAHDIELTETPNDSDRGHWMDVACWLADYTKKMQANARADIDAANNGGVYPK